MSVHIEDNATDEGQTCFKISTPTATYFFQKEAGGFSSMLDADGRDWLNFHPNPSPSYPASGADAYRGMPNLVHGGEDDGVGHPGFRTCSSQQLSENVIESVSQSGNWRTRWTFLDDYAELEVLEAADRSYWFLYEGTPGGRYAPQAQTWGNSADGARTDQPDYVLGSAAYGVWQWAYVVSGERALLFVKQGEPVQSTFSFLGNTEAGVTSPDGMVVLGLGRGEEVESYLRGPQRFRMSFVEADASLRDAVETRARALL